MTEEEFIDTNMLEHMKSFENERKRALEIVLMNIAKQCLGHEPNGHEDGKRFCIGTNPNNDYYLISFDNVSIGSVQLIQDPEYKFKYVFTPTPPITEG